MVFLVQSQCQACMIALVHNQKNQNIVMLKLFLRIFVNMTHFLFLEVIASSITLQT
jgi:hypothetical protein